MILSLGRSILIVQTGYVYSVVLRGMAPLGSQCPRTAILPTSATRSPKFVKEQVKLKVTSVFLIIFLSPNGLEPPGLFDFVLSS